MHYRVHQSKTNFSYNKSNSEVSHALLHLLNKILWTYLDHMMMYFSLSSTVIRFFSNWIQWLSGKHVYTLGHIDMSNIDPIIDYS